MTEPTVARKYSRLDLKPGMYFLSDSLLTIGVYGVPRVCTRISKSRVYFKRIKPADAGRHWEDRGEEFCSLSSVTVVRPTLEEILELHALGNAHVARVQQYTQESLVLLRESIEETRLRYQPLDPV